ncbi:unnamed protein product [Paramecium sonneborni]|uniref:Arf-GAP domain-containing protein n=1 Tax=Paramecium sonneborni TaxID=65129 RepID=A0A8S1PKQ1_9CILI|nr:unnamed protein product [Paramecium sonneborni]
MNKQHIPAKAQEKIFGLILKRPENLICADCATKGPRWVSLDYGVFICMDCAGAHRTLGPSVTRVRSTNIDGWYQENIDIMESIGNATANSYWENTMPKNYIKPTINTGLDSLIRFVQEKYIKKKFIPSQQCLDPKQQYMLTKTTVKPFYFHNIDTKQEESKVKLGDLIDLNEQFDNFGVKENKIEIHHANNTQYGTTHSLSPDKDQNDFIQTQSSQNNHVMHSLPSLDILNLYKPDQQLKQNMQSQQNIPHKNANYAYLQNLGIQSQQQQQQQYYQQIQNNNAYFNHQSQQQQFQQNMYQQQQTNFMQQQQQYKSNGPINIMELYQR